MTSPASCRLSRPAVAEDGLTSPTVSPGLSATGSNRPRVAAIALPPPTSGNKAASAALPMKFRLSMPSPADSDAAQINAAGSMTRRRTRPSFDNKPAASEHAASPPRCVPAMRHVLVPSLKLFLLPHLSQAPDAENAPAPATTVKLNPAPTARDPNNRAH